VRTHVGRVREMSLQAKIEEEDEISVLFFQK
jgi:hypothetical protein